MTDPNQLLREAKAALDKATERERSRKNDEDRKFLVASIGNDLTESLRPVLEQIAENSKFNKGEIEEIIRGIKVDAPAVPQATVEVKIPPIVVPEPRVTVNVPEIKLPVFNLPEIKIPTIKVPKPEVTVNIPETKFPEIVFPEQLPFPSEMNVKAENALPVILTDVEGKKYSISQFAAAAGGGKNKQYQEADVASLITGLVMMGESNDTIFPIQFGSGVSDRALRVTMATDSSASVSLSGTVETRQVSGSIDSVYITGIANSSFSEIQNGDGRLRVSVETGSSGLTDNELRAAHLDVVQMSGSVDSVIVNSFLTSLEANQVSGTTWSTFITGFADSSVVYEAMTTNKTAKADGADIRPKTDDLGRQVMRPVQVRDLITTGYATLTTGAEGSLVVSPASTFLDLVYIMAANQSGATANVNVRSGTAGSVVATLAIPANATQGVSLAVPIPQSEVAATWTVQNSGIDISNTTIIISALFSQEV